MPKYDVIGNVKRGGKLLPRHKPADFDAEEGDSLVRRGYLAPISTQAADKTKAADKTSGAGAGEPRGSAGQGNTDSAGKSAAKDDAAGQAGQAGLN